MRYIVLGSILFAAAVQQRPVNSFAAVDYDSDQNTANSCNLLAIFIQETGHAAPYVPIMSSWYHMQIGYVSRQIKKHALKNLRYEITTALSKALIALNDAFHQLEDMINDRFNELEGFVDRKQFESDITDPSSILWGTAQAYLNQTSEKQLRLLQKECDDQTPWKIAMKIYNRLYGPDNTLMTQIKANHYTNQSFMHTKDMIMYRMFQMMTVQSMCLGLEYGDDYDLTKDFEMLRMNDLYESAVQNIMDMRKRQEDEYFVVALPELIRGVLQQGGNNWDKANRMYQQLTENYGWENFALTVTDKGCDDRRGFTFNSSATRMSSFYDIHNFDRAIKITRYWPVTMSDDDKKKTNDDLWNMIQRQPRDCGIQSVANMIYGYKHSPPTLSSDVDWYDKCVTNAAHHPQESGDSVFYMRPWCSNSRALSALQVYGADSRPGDIMYDLGFWIRPEPVLSTTSPDTLTTNV